MQLRGVFTALITPFRGSELDEEGLRLSIRRQLQAGVHGLVVLGTTGEAPTVSAEERRCVISLSVAEVAGQVPVVVGCTSNSTAIAVQYAREAKQLGADLCLSATPYYNKPTQAGILQHFCTIADQGQLPVILYNHPFRTATPIALETAQVLAAHPAIVGIKDASADAMYVSSLAAIADKRPFAVFSSDESTTLAWMSLGAVGVVSGGANSIPETIVRLYSLIEENRVEEARLLHRQLLPFFRFLTVESNPIPLKALLAYQGLPSGGCRLPLTPLDPAHHAMMKQVAASHATSINANV